MTRASPKWDERYARGEHAGMEPDPLLVRAVEEFGAELFVEDGARPRALDVACGAGRHAVFLAARGFSVTAVDSSRVGVGLLEERARASGLEVDARVADLERGEFAFEPGAYALVCDFQYLQRDLFPVMRAAVRRGGLFVAATHMQDERPGLRPMNPDFLLRAGELREYFRGWELLHYEEARRPERLRAEIVARRTDTSQCTT